MSCTGIEIMNMWMILCGGKGTPAPPPPPGPLTADVRVPPQISLATLIDNFSLPCVCFVVYIYYNKDTVTVFKRQTLASVWQGTQGISPFTESP